MTVLNVQFQPDLVFIVGDTVVSDPSDMSPAFFMTKVYPVPLWKGVICGTGLGNLLVAWFPRVTTSILARDIRHLNEFVPPILRELSSEHQGYAGTSTIYHFGFDERENRFIGFAYRSSSDFISETLPYGTLIKPNPNGAIPIEVERLPDDFVGIACQQKALDDSAPSGERVGIGGELFAYALQRETRQDGKSEVVTTIARCHTFDDYEPAYQCACDKLPANAAG